MRQKGMGCVTAQDSGETGLAEGWCVDPKDPHSTTGVLCLSGDCSLECCSTTAVHQYWMWVFRGPPIDGVTPRLTAAAQCRGVTMLNSSGLAGPVAVLL